MSTIASAAVFALLLLSGHSILRAEANTKARLGPGSSPQWSPNGQWVSFVHAGYLNITRADGTGETTKLTPYNDSRYVWASDSELVVAERKSRRSDTVAFRLISFAPSLDDSLARRTIDSTSLGIQLKLAVERTENSERIIGPMTLAGGSAGYLLMTEVSQLESVIFHNLLTGRAITKEESDWPIPFISATDSTRGWGDLFIGSPKGRKPKRLTNGMRLALVSLASTGDRLIALSMPSGAYCIVDTSGTILNPRFAPIRILAQDTIVSATGMSWSPDGNQIAFVESSEVNERSVSDRLLVSDISGANVDELLSEDWGFLGAPSWRPDGRAIVITTSSTGMLVVEVVTR